MLFPETLDRIYIFADRLLFFATRFNFICSCVCLFLPFFSCSRIHPRDSSPSDEDNEREKNLRAIASSTKSSVANGFVFRAQYSLPTSERCRVIETILDTIVFVALLWDSYLRVVDKRITTFLILHEDARKPQSDCVYTYLNF